MKFVAGCSAPKLAVAVSLDPQDCVRVPVAYPIDYYEGSVLVRKVEGFVDIVYVRMKVRNDGRSLAREVHVFAESVTTVRAWRY